MNVCPLREPGISLPPATLPSVCGGSGVTGRALLPNAVISLLHLQIISKLKCCQSHPFWEGADSWPPPPGTCCTNRARKTSKMNVPKNSLGVLSSPATTTAPTELMPSSGTSPLKTLSLWWMEQKPPLWITTGETVAVTTLKQRLLLHLYNSSGIGQISRAVSLLLMFLVNSNCHCIAWASTPEQQKLWHYDQRDGPASAHAPAKGEVQATREGRTSVRHQSLWQHVILTTVNCISSQRAQSQLPAALPWILASECHLVATQILAPKSTKWKQQLNYVCQHAVSYFLILEAVFAFITGFSNILSCPCWLVNTLWSFIVYCSKSPPERSS